MKDETEKKGRCEGRNRKKGKVWREQEGKESIKKGIRRKGMYLTKITGKREKKVKERGSENKQMKG